MYTTSFNQEEIVNDDTESKEYYEPSKGIRVRFDKGKEGAPGFEGVDHYYIYNPKSTSKMDYYLNINGIPVPKYSNSSHILPF